MKNLEIIKKIGFSQNKITLKQYLLTRLLVPIILSILIVYSLQHFYVKQFIEDNYVKEIVMISNEVKSDLISLFDRQALYTEKLKGYLLKQSNLSKDQLVIPSDLTAPFEYVLLLNIEGKVIENYSDYDLPKDYSVPKLESLYFGLKETEHYTSMTPSDDITKSPMVCTLVHLEDQYLLTYSHVSIDDFVSPLIYKDDLFEVTLSTVYNSVILSSDKNQIFSDKNSKKSIATEFEELPFKLYTIETDTHAKYYNYENIVTYDQQYVLGIFLNKLKMNFFLIQSSNIIVAGIMFLIAILTMIIMIIKVKLLNPLNELNRTFLMRTTGSREEVKIKASRIKEINETLEVYHEMDYALYLKEQDLENYIYIATNDLQEPLRIITSYLEILKIELAASLDEETKPYFDYVTESADNIKTRIMDLLSYSRTGKSLVRTPLNLNHCLIHAMNRNQLLIDVTNTRIINSQLPDIIGDRTLIIQLFDNLIRNAIKFCKENEPPLIEIYALEDVLYVKDYGIGIDECYFKEIFKPFKKLHPAHVYPGSGIGLALCKRICESHNFTIDVESKINEYTTFKIFMKKNASLI